MKPLNVVVGVLIAGLVFALVTQTWLARSRASELALVQKTASEQAVALKQRDSELRLAKLASEALQARLDTLNTQHLSNANQTETAVEQIRKEYAQKPVTPDNVSKKEQAISQAKLQGLWRAYCIGQSDPNCEVK